MKSLSNIYKIVEKNNTHFVGILSKRCPQNVLFFLKTIFIANNYIVEQENITNLLFSYSSLLFQETNKVYITCIESTEDIKKLENFKANRVVAYIPSQIASSLKNSDQFYNADDSIVKEDIDLISSFHDSDFIKESLKKCRKITAEQLLNYARYAPCIQKAAWGEFVEKLHKNESEITISLFDLAQYFFQKNKTEFYRLWSQAIKIYPAEFWGIYWSDQLWYAYVYTGAIQKKENIPALCSKKLPRWFVQGGYKKYDYKDFTEPLFFIAEYETANKIYNNNTIALENLFAKWFL